MIARPTFDLLKSNYRTLSTEIHACKMIFPNTCAIRMSEALVRSDAAFLNIFKSSGKNICPDNYVRGAQDLGAVLASKAVFGVWNIGWNGKAGDAAPASISGKKGIVCYMKIPGFAGQGHIDLGDGAEPVGQAYWDAATIWLWVLK